MGTEQIIDNAALLVTDWGSNPEYERAIVEYATVLLGKSSDDYDEVQEMILRA